MLQDIQDIFLAARDFISERPWRRSIKDETASAYVNGVWREGGSELCERDRHFFQVGATFQGKRISDDQHNELCDSVVRGLALSSEVPNVTCFKL